MRPATAVCAILALPLLASIPQPSRAAATVTIVDGAGSLLRGTSRYTLLPGVRLQPADIIEVAEKGSVQVELGDGTAIAFGAEARAMLLRVAAPGAEVVVIRGPVKIATAKNGAVRVRTPQFAGSVQGATATLLASPDRSDVFDEVGTVEVSPAGAPGKASSGAIRMAGGQFCSVRAGERPATGNDAPAAFVAALPRPFLDALPLRLGLLKNRDVAPAAPRPFTYAEVEPWVNSIPLVRRVVAERWKAKAGDPSFRRALLEDLKAHPEWTPILFPPKSESRRPSAGRSPGETHGPGERR